MHLFGFHIATLAAIFLTAFFSGLALTVSLMPAAPRAIKFAFAGVPVLLGAIAISYLHYDVTHPTDQPAAPSLQSPAKYGITT